MFKRQNDFTDSERSEVTEEELEQTEDEEGIHHLAPTWALWLWVGDRSMEWGQCLKKQCDINSIEDFCALKCRIIPPSRLPSPKISYYVFKSGIKPMWEDEYNQGGGAIHLHIGHQYQHSRLDRYWFELLMAGFGGQFGEHNNKICGFTCRNGMKGYVLSIWVTDVSSVKMYNPIMEIVEAKLGITNNGSVNFSISKHPPPSQYGRSISIPVVSGANAVEQGEE